MIRPEGGLVEETKGDGVKESKEEKVIYDTIQ